MYSNFSSQYVRIYNGVKHPVNIYLADPENITSDGSRAGTRFILQNDSVKPIRTIPEMRPLSLVTIPQKGIEIGGMPLDMPILKYPQPKEIIPSEYDVIIVSDMYAKEMMLRAYAGIECSDADFDFLDRLYTVGPEILRRDRSKCGNTSLMKVVAPNGACNPANCNYNQMNGYLNAYRTGRVPSLAAVSMYISLLQNQNPNIVANNDFRELHEYLQSDIQRRREYYYYQGVKVYNV